MENIFFYIFPTTEDISVIESLKDENVTVCKQWIYDSRFCKIILYFTM